MNLGYNTNKMADITTFTYLGTDYEIEWNEHEGFPYCVFNCDDIFIEFSHPDMNCDPFTVIAGYGMKKEVRAQIGKFLVQFIMPLRDKVAPKYTIYLNIDNKAYQKWSELT